MATSISFCPCFRFGRLRMGTTALEESSMVMIVESRAPKNEKNVVPEKKHVDFFMLGK